jgi:hypothetical protein
MRRGSLLVTATTGLAILAAAAVTVVHAAPTGAGRCTHVGVMKTMFPKAETVGFDAHSRVQRVGRRHPYWPGWCGNWRTRYTGIPGLPSAFAEVTVSLYKTRRDALIAFGEPLFGSTRVLPNGVRMKTLVSTSSGSVASIVGNVFISSNGCCGPPPGYQGSKAVNAQIRIHRRIHAAILAVG